jgi:hypothetical protein
MTNTATSVQSPIPALPTPDPSLLLLPAAALILIAVTVVMVRSTVRSRYDYSGETSLAVPIAAMLTGIAGVWTGVLAIQRITEALGPLGGSLFPIIVVLGVLYFMSQRSD